MTEIPDFSFGNPERLLLLWLLVPLVALLVYGSRAAGRRSSRLSSKAMFARLATTGTKGGLVTRGTLFVLGIGLLMVAASKPRFGFRYEEVKRRGVDLVVAIDVSRSMLSTDVSPNRLERAKVYVRDLMARVRGDRVGLVAFAGKAVPVCPLTVDQGFFLSTLGDLSPDSAPRGGTAIGDAIRSALEMMPREADRDSAMVLITDGEDHESFPLEAAASARERGVKIFTVGIGDPNEGARVPGKDGAMALTYDGKEVVSKMDESMLTRIALDTGGAYVPARTGTYDLGQIYTDHLVKLRAADLSTEKRRRFVEQYQWFAAAGFVLLMLARLLQPLRRRSIAFAQSARAAVVLALALPFATAARAAEGVVVPELTTKLSVNAAVDAFSEGKAEEALKLLDVIPAEQASVPRAQLARGAALQRLGKNDDARAAYEKAAAGSDPDTTLRARFNLGTLEIETAKTTLGEHPEEATGETRTKALATFDLARDHFRAAIDLDPKGEDARHNLELLRLYVKNLKDLWKKHDEEEARKKKEAEPFLDQMARMWKEQETLWIDVRHGRASLGAAPSPVQPTSSKDLATRQKALASDVPLLKKKLEDALAQQEKQGKAPPQDKAVLDAFFAGIDQIGTAMEKASTQLEATAPADVAAVGEEQKSAAKGLGQAFLALAPYDKILKRGLEIQADVMKLFGTPPHPEQSGHEDANDKQGAAVESTRAPDAEVDAFQQEWQDPLATVLAAHAESELPQLEKSPEPKLPDGGSGADPKQQEAAKKQLEQQKKQREALIESMKRAKEKAPKIPPLAKDGSDLLGKSDLEGAAPKAREIEQILKDIAEPLKDDDKDKGDSQDDKKQDDQQKQDDKKQDDKKQDDPQKQDDKKQDPKKGDKDKPQQDLSKEKMEQMLRQATAREKEFEKKKRDLLRSYLVPVPVEKDW